MPRCTHSDSFTMPDVKGRETGLCRCRTCNRDFACDTGLLVEWDVKAGRYVYTSSRRPVL